MEQEKKGGTSFCFLGWFHRTSINPKILGGKLFQAEDAYEVKYPDNHALEPVDPHNRVQAPLFGNGQKDGYQV